MNDSRLQIAEWPKGLGHVLNRFERSMHQEFMATKTESGHVRRRPTTTPFPVFQGTVELNAAEKAALDQFFEARMGSHFSFKNPHTGGEGLRNLHARPFRALYPHRRGLRYHLRG